MGKENFSPAQILILDAEEKFMLDEAGHAVDNLGSIKQSEILEKLSKGDYDFIVIPHDEFAFGKIKAIPERDWFQIIIVSLLGLNFFQKESYAKLGVTMCVIADEIIALVGNFMKSVKLYAEVVKLRKGKGR